MFRKWGGERGGKGTKNAFSGAGVAIVCCCGGWNTGGVVMPVMYALSVCFFVCREDTLRTIYFEFFWGMLVSIVVYESGDAC